MVGGAPASGANRTTLLDDGAATASKAERVQTGASVATAARERDEPARRDDSVLAPIASADRTNSTNSTNSTEPTEPTKTKTKMKMKMKTYGHWRARAEAPVGS